MKKCPYCAEEIQDEAIVCRYCGRDIGTQPTRATQNPPPHFIQQITPPSITRPHKKLSTTNILLIVLGCLCVLIYLLFQFGKVINGIGYHSVGYQVTGHGSAFVTYENAQGGTEQASVDLPWNLFLGELRSGQFIYVSAQADGFSVLTCYITVDGENYKLSTSTGDYVIATCSGSVP